MHDDYAMPADQWMPTVHPLLSYTAVYDGAEMIGIFIVAAHSDILWEIHDCFLPYAWGARARRAAREFREWIWAKTNCRAMIGYIVASNRAAIAYAKAGGMNIWGTIPKSFMKNGVLQDQFLVGISRPEGI